MKKVYVETYGCQMNEYDSEIVKTVLADRGYELVDSLNDADIVLLNTCSIRENANRKSYGRVHRIKHPRNGRARQLQALARPHREPGPRRCGQL